MANDVWSRRGKILRQLYSGKCTQLRVMLFDLELGRTRDLGALILVTKKNYRDSDLVSDFWRGTLTFHFIRGSVP